MKSKMPVRHSLTYGCFVVGNQSRRIVCKRSFNLVHIRLRLISNTLMAMSRMQNYIDGFVFPIAKDRLDEYKVVADAVARIYLEHGAIDYKEFVGDDMQRQCTLPFPELMKTTNEQTVVFGWIIFENRDSRDRVNRDVEQDPRMAELVTPLMDPSNPIFEPGRMAYGGFAPLVEAKPTN